MKKCPVCKKSYDDSLRFCQADGSALVEEAEPKVVADDPLKTMVSGRRPPLEEDILQLPDRPGRKSRGSEDDKSHQTGSRSTSSQLPPPELPKFSEPSLSQPNFGDLSSPKPTSPFESPTKPQTSEPFSQSSYATPVERLSSQFQTPEWTPPPAPIASWQDQGLGSQTPFAPPMATAGLNQTLPIVSLVCGILGLCCVPGGIAAIITGYLGRQNALNNPNQYGGAGMALAGMILGGISIVLTIVWIIFQIMFGAFGAMQGM